MNKKLRKFKRLLNRALDLTAATCGYDDRVVEADQASQKVIEYFKECCNAEPPDDRP